MKKSTRDYYSKEYKLNAINQVLEGGERVSHVARDLGINRSLLSQWLKRYKEKNKEAFPGNGKLTEEAAKIRALEREVKILKEEKEILKKATAFFARQT